MGKNKKCWNIIHEDILTVFNDYHRHGKLARGYNPSFIALIPKKENPSSLDNFRPISLIGSLYKIIAKVLAERLKRVIGKVIGDTQTAFIQGRNILDGVVALNEAIEDSRKTKSKSIFLKIDFAKAFDSISWDYLLDVKRKLNFPEQWIFWISSCLSSAKANVLVNGSPSGEFDLQRGVRQGDPLSPFLFLIAAEGLNLLTRRAVDRNLIKACSIGKDNVSLSHLQYADDMIFIVKGESDNIKAIRWLLLLFELVSGLSVNYEKCSAYGTNLEKEELSDLVGIFGCRVGSLPIPYLGLKVGNNLRMGDGWQEVLHKVEKKISKWDTMSFSMAGRITLIKSVLATIPIYTLSLLPLPINIFNRFNRLFRDFLWGSKGVARKIAWIKWEDLLLPKSEGGLGFINLLSFNKALLCKWVWRFLSNENSLWKRLIISRHGKPPWLTSGALNNQFRKPTSGWWRKIISLVDGERGAWFWNLVYRRLGDGKSTSFWDGAWLGNPPLKSLFPRLFNLCSDKEASVNDMGAWEDGVWNWKLNWRRELRCSEITWTSDLLSRLIVHPSSSASPDNWSWLRKPSHRSSVRHMYLELEKQRRLDGSFSQGQQFHSHIWTSCAPHKAQILAWRLCRNRLPTLDNLHKRIGLDGASILCCFCQDKEETSSHLFLDCTKVRMVWDSMISWIGMSWAAPRSPSEHFHSFSFLNGGRKNSKILSGLWICIVWVWWKWRNEIVFNKKVWNFHRTIDEIKSRFWNWCVAHEEIGADSNFSSWAHVPRFSS